MYGFSGVFCWELVNRVQHFVTTHLSDHCKSGSPDLMHILSPGFLNLRLGVIVNLSCPCVYSPGSNLFPQRGDAVMSGPCSVREVLQMGNNKLLTSIKWNFSERFLQTGIAGEFTLVVDFCSKQTAGVSDCVPGEGFLFYLLISHHQCFVSYKLNQLTYYGNKITHLWTWEIDMDYFYFSSSGDC